MSQSERQVRGMYFEDFEVGMAIETPARTIFAADIANFASLTGDFNEVHSNIEYAKTTPFGDVIAHGPMIYGIAGGLVYASGINDGTLLALLGIDNWKLKTAVLAGDTIRLRQTVVELRETSKPDRGVVKMSREVLNQRDEVVQTMDAALLYRRRSEN